MNSLYSDLIHLKAGFTCLPTLRFSCSFTIDLQRRKQAMLDGGEVPLNKSPNLDLWRRDCPSACVLTLSLQSKYARTTSKLTNWWEKHAIWFNKQVCALTLILSGHKTEKLLVLSFSTAAKAKQDGKGSVLVTCQQYWTKIERHHWPLELEYNLLRDCGESSHWHVFH